MRAFPLGISLAACGAVALMLGAWSALASADDGPKQYFGIQVVDDVTGRGVPMVELRTVNDIVLHTDSAGWAAFREPGLMDREVFFAVTCPGYEYPKDGFGYRGRRLTTTPGKSATLKLRRTNIAERMYRVTGQGIYRDSELLGRPLPAGILNLNAGVLGQDSVQAVRYRGKVFWLWGDTTMPDYPLGNFQTTAATSPLPGKGFDPEQGVPLTYFQDFEKPDRLRKMAPLKEFGLVWLFGLLSVHDAQGKETLVAHYSRLKQLGEVLEHGLVRFDDESGTFKKIAELDLAEKWRYPRGNAFHAKDGDGDYFYFTSGFAHTRVPAKWESVIDPTTYEALAFDPSTREYRWQRDLPPTTQSDERKLIEKGELAKEKARYQLVDAESEQRVDLHHSSIAWNEYRNRWILLGLQYGAKESLLGEVWYAEAESPTGPWRKAVKIATHPHYSFYNPRQHTFMDQEGGRFICFEGTYTRTFSGNPVATPRYDYNQLMYRLDLSDERLKPAQ